MKSTYIQKIAGKLNYIMIIPFVSRLSRRSWASHHHFGSGSSGSTGSSGSSGSTDSSSDSSSSSDTNSDETQSTSTTVTASPTTTTSIEVDPSVSRAIQQQIEAGGTSTTTNIAATATSLEDITNSQVSRSSSNSARSIWLPIVIVVPIVIFIVILLVCCCRRNRDKEIKAQDKEAQSKHKNHSSPVPPTYLEATNPNITPGNHIAPTIRIS